MRGKANKLMRKLITILLFPVFCFGQNKDWQELQSKIDTAVKYNGIVTIDRNYTIDLYVVVLNYSMIGVYGKGYKSVKVQN